MLFEAGLARGEGGLSPALLTVMAEKGDYAFLSLKTSAFDLSDRGVSGRPVPAGLDAFVYAERGVYRSGETVYLTSLLRDGKGNAATGAPLTLVVERPDGVEYRRAVLPDQGAGGRSLTLPLNAVAPTGTWRVRAFTDPKAPAVGETTFMVEDYVADRIEFTATSAAKFIEGDKPISMKVDGHFLYGAPASALQLEGEIAIGQAVERPGYAGYVFGANSPDEESSTERQQLEGLPQTDANGRATFDVALAKVPNSVASAGSEDLHPHGGIRRPRGRAQRRAADCAESGDDRHQAVVHWPQRRRRRERQFRCRVRRTGRDLAGPRRIALRTAQDGVALSMVSPRLLLGL